MMMGVEIRSLLRSNVNSICPNNNKYSHISGDLDLMRACHPTKGKDSVVTTGLCI